MMESERLGGLGAVYLMMTTPLAKIYHGIQKISIRYLKQPTTKRFKKAMLRILVLAATNGRLKGRLLTPDAAHLQDFPIHSNDVIHAVFAAPGQQGGAQAFLQQQDGTSSLLHPNNGVGIGGHRRISRRVLHGVRITPDGRAVRSPGGTLEDDDEEDSEEEEEWSSNSTGSEMENEDAAAADTDEDEAISNMEQGNSRRSRRRRCSNSSRQQQQ
jgi:hypothetical protein